MKPILIICHAKCEPPGYLCIYFDNHNIPYTKITIDDHDINDIALTDFAGLVLMGGPHSVYEDHAWISDELKLIQQALEVNLPLMGVCFGAQMISKALGAQVCEAHSMETGWHSIFVDKSQLPQKLATALPDSFEVFQWHEDTFNLPDGAIPLFSGEHIENQGYILGNLLTMQFHMEMTEHMVLDWLGRYNECLPVHLVSVQSPPEITHHLHERLEQLHTIADRIYAWWLSNVEFEK